MRHHLSSPLSLGGVRRRRSVSASRGGATRPELQKGKTLWTRFYSLQDFSEDCHANVSSTLRERKASPEATQCSWMIWLLVYLLFCDGESERQHSSKFVDCTRHGRCILLSCYFYWARENNTTWFFFYIFFFEGERCLTREITTSLFI